MSEGFQLYLIRHGQSGNNAVPDSERVEDPALTELGALQAENLAQRFLQREQSIDVLLTSAFRRAAETMRPLARELKMRPSIWTDLHEVGGCFRGYQQHDLQGCSGMTRDQLLAEFPEFDLPKDIDESGWWKGKPFETYAQATRRTEVQAQRLLDEFLGREIVVACVIHADFKALLVRAFTGLSDYEAADLVNTGVTLLRFKTNTPEIQVFNDASHLDEAEISS